MSNSAVHEIYGFLKRHPKILRAGLGSVGLYKFRKKQVDLLAGWLNSIATDTICIIDVGCFRASFLREIFVRTSPFKSLFSVGIDPVKQEHLVKYSVFLQAAISNKEEGYSDFYVFNDPECNSLRKMRVDRITHDKKQSDRKWFVEREIEKLESVRRVRNMRLSSVIELLALNDRRIHCLKIDAQGSDLEAFLSLGDYDKNVLFVQV